MRKPGDQIPMQIHGIQFNMGHRVQKRISAFFRAGFASRHIPRRAQFGRFGARGHIWRHAAANFDMVIGSARGVPLRGKFPGQGSFGPPVRSVQHRAGHLCQIHHEFSDCIWDKTSSTWPGTLTLRQIFSTSPSGEIKNVARSMPI